MQNKLHVFSIVYKYILTIAIFIVHFFNDTFLIIYFFVNFYNMEHLHTLIPMITFLNISQAKFSCYKSQQKMMYLTESHTLVGYIIFTHNNLFTHNLILILIYSISNQLTDSLVLYVSKAKLISNALSIFFRTSLSK